ncbi:MAG: acetyl-CoA carboxylase biotin carboxyl carrier protein [Cyclobacteriaceae bacterium]|nr:acetyl-CoA carboxylase biotin carboxyl carrier protein [Cyclobacteriaceae bacterium]
MKTKEIRDLIEFISQTGLNEVNIETEELKISVKRDAEITKHVMESTPTVVQAAPAAAPIPVAAATNSASPAEGSTSNATASSNYIEVKSPMIGTFYRSSNPESPVFASVGDTIEVGQTVCIIEAMKLFNEIESEVSGKIVKVMVENASPVEYDQVLFLVDPS